MTTAPIQVEQLDFVWVLRIHRVEKKNALTAAMYEALTAGLEGAIADAGVRAVVITGGESCFTAGNDIGDFIANPPVDEKSPVMRFLRAVSTFPKPLIAAVNGVAVGIGTTLLLHCDLVYAGEGARFSLPFVDLGLVAEGASSLLLPQLVGRRKASELLLLAEPFDAATALAMGLINRVLPPAEVEAFALAQAQKLAAKAPSALQTTKALILRPQQDAIAEAIAVEAHHFAAQLRSPEAMEALQAFMEKRKPRFS
ncbi:MAG: enoyl-CoA hydratase [Caldilineaceae bacterium]|nr:enoyl-CoA hydratase [Caldilineaceae bacterium]